MGKYVYGIDLGTTYSCVAYLDENGNAVVCKNKDSESTTPSVLQLLPGKKPVVGKEAKETAVFEPQFTLKFVKNVIGRKDEDNSFKKIYYGDGEEISPVDASAEILKVLAGEAGEFLEDTVEDVVITCPAYFNNEQREATKEAGRRAGLNVLSILDEPTAAAIAYGLERGVVGQRFLVYDLGGGTFDITVLEVAEDGSFKVVCSEGDHDLGGGRWDAEIINYVTEQWREKFDTDEEMDLESQQDLAIKAEIAKKSLTAKDEYPIGLATDQGKIKVTITRELFDNMTKDLLESSINLTKKAIAVSQGFATYEDENGDVKEKPLTQILEEFDTKFDASQLSKILLVGGSTFMPQVKERVSEVFGLETVSFDPNEAVAKGAAIFALIAAESQAEIPPIGPDSREEDNKPEKKYDSVLPTSTQKIVDGLGGGNHLIHTITNKSYGMAVIRTAYDADGGIKSQKEQIANLIKKGTSLPCDISATFGLIEDNQTGIHVQLFEAENYDDYYDVDLNKRFFERDLTIPSGLSANTPVEVTMSLNEESILKIRVKVAGEELKEDLSVQYE